MTVYSKPETKHDFIMPQVGIVIDRQHSFRLNSRVRQKSVV